MSIRCIRNAAGFYGKYSIYTKYEIDSNNIDDIYELLYNNIQVRNEIICCNENGGCTYYTSGYIHTSLYIKCDFTCDYDVINNTRYFIDDSEIKLKRVSTINILLGDISFELFKKIIHSFEDIVGDYGDNILELTQESDKFLLNMRTECYEDIDSDTDTDTDTSVDIEPL